MDERQGWCESNALPAFESEVRDEGRKVESMRSRKGGQNFSIERILGRVRGGQEGDERLAGQEEEDEGQEQELEEGDEEEEEEVEEEDSRDERITNQEYQLKKEHVHIDNLLGLSSKDSSYPTSIGRVQPILPRPPPLVPPPPTSAAAPSLFPRASPFSQDPFLLTPLQSQRYS